MKHKLTLFPLLAILACSGGSLPEAPPGYMVSVNQSLTAEESRALDAGENKFNLGPDAEFTYTRLVTTDPVETKQGSHQHYRMTFDTSDVQLCDDRPGWYEPTDNYVTPGEEGTPDCLFIVTMVAPTPDRKGWFTSHYLTHDLTHGKNAVEFNNPSGRTFEAMFVMASGRSIIFNTVTGEVIKTTASREEQDKKAADAPTPGTNA